MKSKKYQKYICLLFAAVLLIGAVLPISASAEKKDDTVLKNLKGAKIGVLTGTMLDVYAEENIENPEVCYYNNNTDVAVSLESDKIDAYLTDEPIARSFGNKYPNHVITYQLSSDNYGFIFKKDSAESAKLSEQFNKFLADSKENGLLDEIDERWFGNDESAKTIDFSAVENNNGKTIKMATCTGVGVPFAYVKDGEIVGYEIELTVEFCKANGYNLKIDDYEFAGVMSAVQSDMADIGAACITITDERKESMVFSDPTYSGGIVVVDKQEDNSSTAYTSLDQLKGKKIGIMTGTVFDKIAEKYIESPELCYYNTDTDVYEALQADRIDAYIVDTPVLKIIQKTYPHHTLLEQVTNDEYAYIFQKDNADAAELCKQLNQFLADSRENGLLDEIEKKWMEADEEAQIIDYESAEKNTGKTIKFAMSSAAGAPFTYIKDNKPAGYDVDVAVEFCKAYGYKIEVTDYDFTGLMSAVQSGMADFAGACIAITDERKESMLFSDPNYSGGTAIVVRENSSAAGTDEENQGILTSIKESFTKTFIRENRWQLFLTGIANTMIITVLSIIFGTIIGFAVYMLCRNNNKIANSITELLTSLISGMPVVVLLMILFYIILGKTGLDGVWVAVIGFSLTFGTSVFGMLKTGVSAIDNGQNEAAFALGFSSRRTFFRVILPQASYHFLPIFRSEVVAHIKATAIVGYIAVQDLTKISDIVRTRTYEAFFPLIATAIIYFALEGLLIFAVRNIQLVTDKKRRSPEKILKGIKTK